MSNLTSAIRADLLAVPAIAAAVGTRIRPRKLRQGDVLPAIRMTVVSGREEEHLGGAATLAHATIQIDAYAATSEAADQLADLIRRRLCPTLGRRGSLGGLWVHGLSVQAGLHQTEEPLDDGGDRYRYVSTRDYRVSYTFT